MDQWTIVKVLEELQKRVDALEGKGVKAPDPVPVEPKKATKKLVK